jgi:shikimate kinase
LKRDLPERIALLGFRGAGKTTLGAWLAQELRLPFFDLDREIELAQGRTLSEIFRRDGEAVFREIEAETLEGVIARPGIVLAPGGGIVERPANRALLKARTFAVYLAVPAAGLVARLAAGGRPPLTALPIEEEVRVVLARRDPLYRECAARVLDIGAEEPVEATRSRLRLLLPVS